MEPSSRSSGFYALVSRSFGLCFCAESRRSVLSTREKNGRGKAYILLEKTFAHPIPSHSLHLYTHTYAHTQKHKGIGMFRRRFDWLFTLHANGGHALAVYACLSRPVARSSILGAFQLRYYVQGAIREFAPANAHELCTNKLEMSITRMTLRGLKNLRLKVFETYEFFVRALLCSSNIVPLSGLPMWLKGYGLCLDGALTDIQYVSGFKRSGTFSSYCRRKHGEKLTL